MRLQVEETPFEIYAKDATFPFLSEDGTTRVWKTFRCVLGLGTRKPHPHHDFVCRRGNKFKHQFGIKPDNCDLLWVEFLCKDDLVINRTETGTPGAKNNRDKRRTTAQILKSLQLITPLEEGENFLIDPEKAPKFRVPKPARTEPSEGSRRRRKKRAGNVSEKSPDSLCYTESVAMTDDQNSIALPKDSDEELDIQNAILESHKEHAAVQKDAGRNPSEETE